MNGTQFDTRAAASRQTTDGIYRPDDGRLVAGVAAGLARRFGVPAAIVRVGFVIASVVGGSGFFAYAIALVAMPPEGDTRERGDWTRWLPYALFAAAVLALGDAGTYSRAAEGIGDGLSGVLLVATSLFLAGLGVVLVIARPRRRVS